MKTPRIVNSVGHIDDDLINDVVKSEKSSKKNVPDVTEPDISPEKQRSKFLFRPVSITDRAFVSVKKVSRV